MLSAVHDQLQAWIGTAVPGTPFAWASPGPADSPVDESASVRAQWLSLAKGTVGPQVDRRTFETELRYLVWCEGGDPLAQADRLGELLRAAVVTEGIDVEFVGPDESLWRALERPARPALVLRLPCTLDLVAPKLPQVEKATVRLGPMREVSGLVTGPGDVPLNGARVQLAGGREVAVSDRRGRFGLALPGAGSAARTELTVIARGREKSIHLGAGDGASPDDPIVVRFETLED